MNDRFAVQETSRWDRILGEPTLAANFERRVAATPDGVALMDEHDRSLTWAQFDAAVDRVAAALAAEGVRCGSRVVWQLPTRISTVLVMFALRRLGALQAPVIPLYKEREVGAAVRSVNADFLFVPGTWNGIDYVEMAGRLDLGDVPAPTIVEIGPKAPESEADLSLAAPQERDEVAWVYFTSGSTAAPKGARHTDGTILTASIGLAGLARLNELGDDIASIAFPIAHVGGIQYLAAAICVGMPMVLVEAFVPQAAAELFRRLGVTQTGGAPPFYQAFADLAQAAAPEPLLPRLRLLTGGGAPCPPDLFHQVRDVLDATVAHSYGMTEVPMVAVADPQDPPEILAATDGHPIPGNKFRIVAADGVPVEQGTVGEVHVSGGAVCHGYTDRDETQKAFTADGWFRTGDLARMHPSGQIEVVGRLKDVIIRKGENVSPQEVEELLASHPAIAEVAVIGVPDAERGEMVCAVVALRDGTNGLDLAAITTHLTEARLMKQKMPERLEIVESLPRTGLAKVAKAELRARFGTRT